MTALTAIRAIVVVATLLGGALVMRLVYEVRLHELGENLETTADKTAALRSLGLIARFQLIRSRMKSGEDMALLRREARSGFAMGESLAKTRQENMSLGYSVGLRIINFVNVIAGGRPLTASHKSRADYLREDAYLSELQRDFPRAIAYYDQLIGEVQGRDADTESFSLLHRGFCHAILSQKGKAVEDLAAVVKANRRGEYRFTAEVLLAYLEDFSAQAEKIAVMPDSIKKGKAYYDIGAYLSAIRVMEGLPAAQKDAQANFVLARSYEEIGKSEKALASYRQLIEKRPRSQYARLANRRIYAIGAIYSGGKELIRESEQAAQKKIADPELLKEKARTNTLVMAIAERSEEKKQELRAMQSNETTLPPVKPVVPAPPVEVAPAKIAAEKPVTRPVIRPVARKVAVKQKPVVEEAPPVRVQEKPPIDHDALSREERKKIISSEGEIDQLVLGDGNRIWGIVINEQAQKLVVLTVMGKLEVDKSQVVRREKIPAETAFR
ncbi:MAG: tetratricopeptide repeat protein [Turneriella sp.]